MTTPTVPRRIAMVITRSDAVGGAQIHVLEVSRALLEAGHTVRVFVGGTGPFVTRLREGGVPVTSLRHLVRPIDPRHDIRAVPELHAMLRGFRPDLISTHSSKAGLLGRGVARLMRCPVISTVHGQLITPGRLTWSQRAVALIERAGTAIGGLQVAVSEYDRQVAIEHGVVKADRIRVVHNGIPDVESDLVAQPADDPPRIVMVARLDEPKDPFTVVEALARLSDVPWNFDIIGDGPQRERLEQQVASTQVASRIRLLGTRDDVPAQLAAAQIFVLSSQREGFPISILEAMRAGLPVVASRVGGIAESVVAGVTGQLFARGDAADLAAKLRPLLENPALRQRVGRAGRARFALKFELGVAMRRLWAVYAEALEVGRAAFETTQRPTKEKG